MPGSGGRVCRSGWPGFVVFEPVEAAFDDVAAAVGRAVEPAPALTAPDPAVDQVDPFRDGGLDPASAETGADLRGRAALVRGHPFRPGARTARPAPLDADAGRYLLELGAVVDVAGGEGEGQGGVPARRRRDGSSWSVHRGTGRSPRPARAPFSGPGGMLMGLYGRGVHAHHRPVDGSHGVGVLLVVGEQAFPSSVGRPAAEALVDGPPGTVPLGQVPPPHPWTASTESRSRPDGGPAPAGPSGEGREISRSRPTTHQSTHDDAP